MIDKFVHPSVLEKLIVGQRVRYVPDGDCFTPSESGSASDTYGAIGHESHFDAEGKIGVIQSASETRVEGHPYWVEIDGGFQFGGQSFDGITVAAHELALVEDN